MIKTILFDLGKTLIPFDFSRGYRGMEALCGVSAADIRARLGTTDLVDRFESGLVEPHDFVRELSALIGAEVDYGGFCQAWSSIFLPEPLVPESMIEALHRNYRLLLLSNTNAIHFAMLVETYPMLRHFDDFVLSYKVRALKPDPAIYREAIALAGCRAGECFYTDDVEAYVEGARCHGIQAVQFQSLAQLEDDMRARGIRWAD